jgi:ATP-binding protein involved in chromosome partitioning
MTTGSAKSNQPVTIAISLVESRRLGHLGEARQFALVEVDTPSRAIVRSRVVEAPPHQPGSFPRWLREQGAQVVIAAGLGQRALDNLNHHGVEVRIGQPGAPAESLVAAWLAGQLTRPSNGCAHQHGEAAGHECRLSDYLEN